MVCTRAQPARCEPPASPRGRRGRGYSTATRRAGCAVCVCRVRWGRVSSAPTAHRTVGRGLTFSREHTGSQPSNPLAPSPAPTQAVAAGRLPLRPADLPSMRSRSASAGARARLHGRTHTRSDRARICARARVHHSAMLAQDRMAQAPDWRLRAAVLHDIPLRGRGRARARAHGPCQQSSMRPDRRLGAENSRIGAPMRALCSRQARPRCRVLVRCPAGATGPKLQASPA